MRINKTDYLIIGGGIAGTTAAEIIRKNDPKSTISIISDEPYPLYSRIMISKPKLIQKKVPIKNILLKNMDWYKTSQIEFIKGKTAVKLDAKQKIITLDDGSSITYGKLLLAIGTSARIWDVPCGKLTGVCNLKNLDDAKNLIKLLPQTKSAVVIGSGFVSFEMCDLLNKMGIKTTEVMMEPYFWYPLLDKTAGKIVEKALIKNNITIIREQIIKKVLGKKRIKEVILKNGRIIKCDLILCGIGTINNLNWLKGSGLKVNRGILADKNLKTNLANVWTAGDIAEYEDIILNEQIQLGGWTNAQMHGRTAGLNMSSSQPKPYRNVSTYSSFGFGLTVSFIGDVRALPKRKIISRQAKNKSSYGQIITFNNKIIGAVLINRGGELGYLNKLITGQADISKYTKQLGDANFDLKNLK